MRISIEVSPGELYDKISILEIKLEKINDPEKLRHVKNEYSTLKKCTNYVLRQLPQPPTDEFFRLLETHIKNLNEVNGKIWDVLQTQRDLENRKDFGDKFIQASLDVYHLNDLRASYKLSINQLFQSDIAEVKSYTKDQ